MGKIDSSINESVAFSAKALALSKAGKAAPAAPAASAPAAEAPRAPAREGEEMSISEEAARLGRQAPAATTIDARAPSGSSKRLGAYGEAQAALAPKGSGFDASA